MPPWHLHSLGRNMNYEAVYCAGYSKALKDMEEIYVYISKNLQVPEATMWQYNRIAAAIESLGIFPERIKVMETIV